MLRKFTMFVFVMVLAVAFVYAGTGSSSANTSATSASTAKTSTAKASTAKSSYTKVEGTIQKTDLTKNSLTLQVGTESKQFSFNDKTLFMNGSKHAKATDLKEGEKVTVYADSKKVAHRINIEAVTPTTK